MITLNEAHVEQAALDWLKGLGWQVAHGPDIAPQTPNAERADYGQVVLERRVQDSLAELNPSLPPSALDDAFRKLTRSEGSTLEARNRAFHRMLVEGVTVEYRADGGATRGAQVKVIDFDYPANNDWLAVNQFTVTEDQNTRRPDVVLFIQRPAPGHHRTEEPRRRGRYHLDGVAAAPDLQGRATHSVFHE